MNSQSKYEEFYKKQGLFDLLRDEIKAMDDLKLLSICSKYNNLFNNTSKKIEDFLIDMGLVYDNIVFEYEQTNFLNDVRNCLSIKLDDKFMLCQEEIEDYLKYCESFVKNNLKVDDFYGIIVLEDFTCLGLIPALKKHSKAKIIVKLSVDSSAWFIYLKNREVLKQVEGWINCADLLLTVDKRYKQSFFYLL